MTFNYSKLMGYPFLAKRLKSYFSLGWYLLWLSSSSKLDLDVWHIAYKWSPLLSAWKPYHLFLQTTSPTLSLDYFPVDYIATLWNLSVARVSSYIQSPVAVFTLREDK